MDHDKFLIWLIEQTHNSYLTWITCWLAGNIGIVTILIEFGNQNWGSDYIVLKLLYFLLMIGTSFCVWRVRNIAHEIVQWTNELDNLFIKEKLKENRGHLVKFFVFDDGTPNRITFLLLIILQNAVVGLFAFFLIYDFGITLGIAFIILGALVLELKYKKD